MRSTTRACIAAAQATGADVPVCVDPRARMMRGIGEILSDPLDLPELPAVLVNPGVAVPTRDVFAALAAPALSSSGQSEDFLTIDADAAALVSILSARRNDLETPAIKLQAIIADVLAALQDSPGCLLARMSGSGATCFGLFGSAAAAAEVAQRMRRRSSAMVDRGDAVRLIQLDRPIAKSTASVSAAFIVESGNSASASLAIEP